MPVADPISPAFALVYSTLTGDATLTALISGVSQDVAPDVVYTKPYVVMNLQSGVETNTSNAYRLLSRLILQVQIVGKADPDGATIRSAFARVDALLMPGQQALRNSGGTLALFRENLVSYSEVVAGALWVHLGGLYRCEV